MNVKIKIQDLKEEILENVEYLQTTEGDEVECVSIENLEGILSRYFGENFKIQLENNQ